MQEWALQGWATYSRRYADDPAQLDALPRSQRLSLRSVEHLAHNLADAPAVVLVCGLHGRHSTPGGSSYPAVQNLLLAARALGVGGSIFNLPLRDPTALKTMLDIPENNDIFCVLPLGYPTDKAGPVRRKPVKRVVYWEKFGQTWDFAAAQPDDGWGERWIPDDA